MIALEHDKPALRWGGSLGMVLLAHATLIGAWLWAHALRPPEPQPEPAEAVMVELAPLPTAPLAPPTDLPPGPPQQEQRKAQPKAELEPAPKPEPQQKPVEKAEVALPQQARERQNDASANTDVAETTAPPSVQAPTGSQYTASQSLSGVASQTLVTWQVQVLGHLERFKRYPRAAQRRHHEGRVKVRYAVDRQGNVLSVQLADSSGHESLDAEALAAVQHTSPLPPPPAEILGDPVTVTTPVDFSLRR
jgi:protein TonB